LSPSTRPFLRVKFAVANNFEEMLAGYEQAEQAGIAVMLWNRFGRMTGSAVLPTWTSRATPVRFHPSA